MKECSSKKVLIVKFDQNDPLDSSSQKNWPGGQQDQGHGVVLHDFYSTWGSIGTGAWTWTWTRARQYELYLILSPLIDGHLCDISGALPFVHHVARLRLPCHLVNFKGGQLNANLIKIISTIGHFKFHFTSLLISLCSLFLFFSASLISCQEHILYVDKL